MARTTLDDAIAAVLATHTIGHSTDHIPARPVVDAIRALCPSATRHEVIDALDALNHPIYQMSGQRELMGLSA